MSEAAPEKRRMMFRADKPRQETPDLPPWRVLVVDDDPQIHSMTEVLLRDFRFQDRNFVCISAHSAAQARDILAADPDIPVMLLDVVMESDDAGLTLARAIRRELRNHRIRIILRTGQPGEAPERDVMLTCDINDYRAKTELTAQKLFTALVAALRAWCDIDTIERLNAELEDRVTQRTRELAAARAFSDSLIELLPHPVWVKDVAGRIRRVNRAFREFFGIDGEEWLGRSAEDVLRPPPPPEDLDGDCRLLDGSSEREDLELTVADAADSPRVLAAAKSALRVDGDLVDGIIVVATDVTERRRMEGELRRLALVDPLTGCANRRSFTASACREMERSLRYGQPLSVLMLDLDHFKDVNDSWGHAIGDELLKAAAAAVQSKLRDIDHVGRLGGEEFAVLLPQTDLAGALLTAERLRAAIADIRIPLPEGVLTATVSIGAAQRRADETLLDHLLSRADRAMYAAKNAGRNRVEKAEL